MPVNIYETNRRLHEYLLFHYGTLRDIFSIVRGPKGALGFHARCMDFLIENISKKGRGRALDLGCGVGRAAFELSQHFQEVVAIDYSHAFIQAADQLKKNGRVRFPMVEQGEITKEIAVRPPEKSHRERIIFRQGDASRLPKSLGAFDVVVLMNLIDRLKYPRRCLNDLPRLVKGGGYVLMTSPYSWQTEFTSREKWLGGFRKKGKAIRPLAVIKDLLGEHFELLKLTDIPFVIREHERKFEWAVPQVSLWRKK